MCPVQKKIFGTIWSAADIFLTPSFCPSFLRALSLVWENELRGGCSGKVCMCVLGGEQRSVSQRMFLGFWLYFCVLGVGGDGGETENRKSRLPSVTSAAGDGGEAESRRHRLLLLLAVSGCFTPLCLQRATETCAWTRGECRALQPSAFHACSLIRKPGNSSFATRSTYSQKNTSIQIQATLSLLNSLSLTHTHTKLIHSSL